jgi:hypothetical protein
MRLRFEVRASCAIAVFCATAAACSDLGGLSGGGGATDGGPPEAASPADAATEAEASSGDDASDAAPSPYAAAVLADQPLAYYRFEETSGTVLHDSSGHGHDGLIGPAVTLGVAGLATGSDHAASFDGVDDDGGHAHAAWVAPTAALAPTLVSVECWASARSFSSSYPTLVERGAFPVSPFQPYTLFVHNHSAGAFVALPSDSGAYIEQPAPGIGVLETHHIAMVYDGASLHLYVDAVEVGQRAGGGQIAHYDSTNGLAIGSNWGAGGITFDGTIDEVALYDKALASTQVRAHYLAGARP